MTRSWGICACGGRLEQQFVQIHVSAGDVERVLEAVERGVCDRCGANIYYCETAERIEAVRRGQTLDRRLKPSQVNV